jgi:formylglycine-generating enzyme required for sulfatase activity
MAVGSHPDGASPYGVMDMAGNVGEWVSDWYDSAYYADSPYSNPTGPAETAYKILRGGSFYNNWSLIRTAYRNEYLLANSSDRYGFRCAQSLP